MPVLHFLIVLAGIPTATEFFSIFSVTTAPAPIMLFSSILTPGIITAPVPISTPVSI